MTVIVIAAPSMLIGLLCVTQGTHDQEKDQKRRNRFQRAYEHVSQYPYSGDIRNEQRQDHAYCQSPDYSFDQTDARPFFPRFFMLIRFLSFPQNRFYCLRL